MAEITELLTDEFLRQIAESEQVPSLRESLAAELLAARGRIAELEAELHATKDRNDELKQMITRRDEAAQRPPLGYVVGYYSAHGWTFADDYGGPDPTRAGAEQELANEAEQNPGVDFKLIECREVQS